MLNSPDPKTRTDAETSSMIVQGDRSAGQFKVTVEQDHQNDYSEWLQNLTSQKC